jgi:anti-anti-sigma regulatory factor
MDGDMSTGVKPAPRERAASCKAWVVGFQRVQDVSSVELPILLNMARACRANNKLLALAALLPKLHEVVDVSDFAAIFRILDHAASESS